MVLSYALLLTGDALGATRRREAELAITLAPKDPEYYSWSAAIHEDSQDPATAAERYQRYAEMTSSGEIPPATRIRLAQLYIRADLPDRALPLAQPRFVRMSKLCDPACRHLVLRFDSPFGLATEGPGSARDIGKYTIDGRPLPPGTVIEVIENGQVVTIVGAYGTDLVRSGSTVGLIAVTDTVGLPLAQDATRITVPE